MLMDDVLRLTINECKGPRCCIAEVPNDLKASETDKAAMREEMRIRIGKNIALRTRSAAAAAQKPTR